MKQKGKTRERIDSMITKLKSKRAHYRTSNPLKGLLKSKGRTPNIQIKPGENVNLWR